ncbi:MAG: ribonuclease HII [Brumimicrobium sp.]
MESFFDKNEVEAGCDEAGRGCLAGPVVAAAVILPVDFHHPLLNDSKKISAKKRAELVPVIKEKALSYGVAFVDQLVIDEINILNASFKAMHLALDKLSVKPTSLLIDGNRFHNYKSIKHHCMIKGDGRFASIASASVLAKEARDKFMAKIHEKHPNYGWKGNKGYPTKSHREAIKKYGVSSFHRKSFTLLPSPELDFNTELD